MKAAVAKDFESWAALFLNDAIVNPPNEPSVKGRAAIRAWLEKLPPITEFTLKNEKVEGRGDLAYVLGTYTMTITPAGAPGPVKDNGKRGVICLHRNIDTCLGSTIFLELSFDFTMRVWIGFQNSHSRMASGFV
jgi:ketosteroid isomerase-like protein